MMNKNRILAGAVCSIFSLAAMSAHATTRYSLAGPTPEMATDGSITATFGAAAGPGEASFIIDGYASLDGQNYYEDDFTLSLNGAPILVGTFNLGGGGDNVVYSNPNGGTVDNISGNGTNVTFAGGQVVVDEPLTLLKGTNTLTFNYTSLGGPDHAGFQGLGDEGWGLEKVGVTGVPEPATWAMMLVGFGGLGAAMRSRRGQAAAV